MDKPEFRVERGSDTTNEEAAIGMAKLLEREGRTVAADMLRQLHAENETLKQSVARLQQHHATAWSRGHTMGMKANEDTARRALDAVKQDAWGNTQLTEALLKTEEQRDALLEALKEIVDAADGKGWEQLDPSFKKARAAIKAVEEGK